ncbi:4-(cytidine 5'-diphospho)-2-C-methyl-D-erythritol kinase [Candidatus Neomarinimicrobiota bacterium]
MTLSLHSNSKINLGLRIVGQREDGYHLLHTLFQEIDFGDQLTIRSLPTMDITLAITGTAGKTLPTDSSNLCYRAAQLFQMKTGARKGIQIHLEKRIPVGAGLGGGSSNAAAVLRALNKLWGVHLTERELEEMAVEIGADVPFFIRGGLQLGEGIGETLTPLKVGLPYSILLVIPPIRISTAWAYGQWTGRKEQPAASSLDQLIREQSIPWEKFTNDFESIIFGQHRLLKIIKSDLLKAGAEYASLSGSGSAIYGLFADPQLAERTASKVTDAQAILTKPCDGREA